MSLKLPRTRTRTPIVPHFSWISLTASQVKKIVNFKNIKSKIGCHKNEIGENNLQRMERLFCALQHTKNKGT